MMTCWSTNDMPPLDGRTAVVTGANSGLGLETSRALAIHGARVVMACRNLERGEQAAQSLRAVVPHAVLEVRMLDLASLASIQRFAGELVARHPRLDLLFDNAGVMAIARRETGDGFEMQLGVNHLGHFALTGLLLPAMVNVEGSRVVVVSSMAHSYGRMRFDDLQGRRRYTRWGAYGQSKLANLLFAFELERRLSAARASTSAVAAHPGYASTELQSSSAAGAATPVGAQLLGVAARAVNVLVGQSAAQGALPQLRAGTDPQVHGGCYLGPDRWGGMRGCPVFVSPSKAAVDQDAARRLWEISEELTGVGYDPRRMHPGSPAHEQSDEDR